MLRKLKINISHHQHTGKLIHHEHTSYLPLLLLLMVVGFLLSAFTTYAATPYDGPEGGSIGVTGIMPGKPPTVGAVITSPTNNQRFATSPVEIKGTCPKGLLVEIFKNDIFAGSTFCEDNGTFSIQIDMLYGRNVLLARVYDALNQPGPDSPAVTIFYDFTPPGGLGLANLDFGSAQLLLNTDAVFRGVFPDKEMATPITILGGRPPYAVKVSWGDSQDSLIPRGVNGTFNATHTYKKAGTYAVSIQATDADKRVAFLTVATVVNGQPDPLVAATEEKAVSPNILIALWPLYVAMIAIVTSFWLGERHEKKVLEKHGQLVQQI